MSTKTNQPNEGLTSKLRSHPIAALREEMDDLVSRFFGSAEEGWFAGGTSSADVAETANTIEVSLDLPGVNPDAIHVNLSNNLLSVRAKRTEESDDVVRTFHRMERRRGDFSRSISLPCEVNSDEVVAEYKDGVLRITLPKSEPARTRSIPVKHD